MTPEEKAKAYDEAIKKAAALYKASEPMSGCNVIIETLFPELKESEDEKIREELIKHLKEGAEGYEPAGSSSDYQRWLAWLEKQGQQEEPRVYETEDGEVITFSESKGYGYKVVKPKFKCGDWLIFDENHNSVYQVERIDNYRYYLRHYLGSTMSAHFDNELIRLWTIQDAKNGDVLVHNGCTFIFMGIKDGIVQAIDENMGELVNFGEPDKDNDYCPATKEQRDLLFEKMHEAGYEWDNSTKELKRIEEELQLKKGKYYKCIKSYHYLGCGEYWFDEGKVYFCEKDGYLRSDPYHLIKVDDCKNWQSYFCPYIENPVWDEEDEEMLKSVIATCELAEQDRDSSPAKHLLEMQLNWLKSIKEKIIEL